MTVTMNQISNGMAVAINSDIYIVTEFQHVKPGKGSAFVRVKLRNLLTEAVLEKTLRSADKLEDVPLDETELEFLYRSGDTFHFMDHTSYEQVSVGQNVLGDGQKFLLENLTVTGLSHKHRIIKVILPTFINAKITETEPGIKGDSTKAGTKPAKIETGAGIQVPLFVNTGDMVKIDTRTGQYVERVLK